MSEYTISEVYRSDKRAYAQIDRLLDQEGIRRDPNLDYTCAMYDEDMHIIATGSCFGNTLRCMAVDHTHQGEGLMNEIVSHLIDVQSNRGNIHLFLYTKCSSEKFFASLGFHEIARIEDQIVFMENRRTGFDSWLNSLETKDGKTIGAVVMNANPFTLGHQYLAEYASAHCDVLHLFMVSEDASIFPFHARKKMVMDGTAHLKNIIYHDSGPYIISAATFPSYFQKDERAVIESHAMLDLTVFTKIAKRLGINVRFVAEEPTSLVTGIYNDIMSSLLEENGIRCEIIERKKSGDMVISASTVRQAIHDGNRELLEQLVPETTLNWLDSEEAVPVINKIRKSTDLIHY
ncbi:MAG: [citrate (pro-3S)-lyase] ligase [Erysipelotrichaceae bacterium]|nr:[citrate (pro-3S)-lyase] ligase [Erysipelotrichaceae bacterium]